MSVEFKRTGNLEALINKLKTKSPVLKIGFFDEENATKAYFNEYGSHDGTRVTPARNFMQQTSDKYQSTWVQLLAKAYKKTGDVFKAMGIVGEQASSDMKETIQNGNYAPNAPSTVKQKGKNSPLLDTHDMFNHVTYTVEK